MGIKYLLFSTTKLTKFLLSRMNMSDAKLAFKPIYYVPKLGISYGKKYLTRTQ
ncbi:phosphoglycolate phosphatase [Tolypothrix sp. PCC 7601]|nr:phosphoglycolate phosphatase [Tolypothrix sp. PCC 7601]